MGGPQAAIVEFHTMELELAALDDFRNWLQLGL